MTREELTIDDPCLAGGRAGRREAVDDLFRSYGPMVERVIGRLVGPTSDFEDLVQTTFLEVLRNLERFRGEAKISTWLCGIAVHVAHHYLRAGKFRRHVPLELKDEELAPTLEGASSADQSMDGRRLATKLDEALDRISPKKRNALLLYVVEERSYKEIAALMRATQTATRSRMYFARRELRKAIRRDPALRELAAAVLGDAPETRS
jgi:RNA polymerase sigma-70 factor, ECF subfamily